MSVTQSELAADKPASSADESPASNMITNKETAQKGSKEATVCTPIMETSTPVGKVIDKAGLAPKNPSVERPMGTRPNKMAPNINALITWPSCTAKARCQFDWSEIDPAINPMEVTIPNENATPGSNIL